MFFSESVFCIFLPSLLRGNYSREQVISGSSGSLLGQSSVGESSAACLRLAWEAARAYRHRAWPSPAFVSFETACSSLGPRPPRWRGTFLDWFVMACAVRSLPGTRRSLQLS